MFSVVLLSYVILFIITPHVLSQGCWINGGRKIEEGRKVKTTDPCLECWCTQAQIQCRLRICPKLPMPPPDSCILLQRPNSCCGNLMCFDGTQNNVQGRSNIETQLSHHSEGCLMNGTLYGEGSAMKSSLCEYCYCIKGQQHCVRPQCVLYVPGCTPEYLEHSCCPTKYNCSNDNSTISSTTSIPSTTVTTETFGCILNSSKYSEGEKIRKSGKHCENCYCVKNQIRCEPVICSLPPFDHCVPVHNDGHCCPTSYNCSSSDDSSEKMKLEEKEVPEIYTTTFTIDTTLLTTESETTTMNSETTISFEDATNVETTTFSETTTIEPSLLRSIPPALEAIINRTLERDAYDDYDYNDSSLPPSLPNLKIIPFVAADAVVNDNNGNEFYDEKIKFRSDLRLERPYNSKFSPPAETEGGFLPRDPLTDGIFFKKQELETKSETTLNKFPPITEPSKLFVEGQCKSKGQFYMHGEVTSKSNSCELCVCYFGEIHCKKAKCTDQVHCSTDSCCECVNIDEIASSTFIPEAMSNIPAITIADIIATPNPFKDVIRTEPAPDLVDILKDMLPKEKNITQTKNVFNETKQQKPHEYKQPSQPITTSIPNDDDFSFGSVLDLIFGTSETTTEIQAERRNEEDPDTNLIFNPYEDDHFKNQTKTTTETPAQSSPLKLAGCNIYGRMYKIGIKIDELSNPCLECMCTDFGVQCKKIKC